MNMKRTAPPRRVDFKDDRDLDVVIMGLLGLSTQVVMNRTRYSACQVAYRLRKAGVKRSEYRNGENAVAKKAIALSAFAKHEAKRITRTG